MKEIIYIVGPSRSGSSLLESRLNSRDRVRAFGELRWFFNRGYIKNEICSCSKKFHDCDYWGQYKNFLTLQEASDCDDLRTYFDKFRNIIPFYFKFLRSKKWKKNLLEYSKYLLNLYTRISQDSDVIVDNSKSPFYFLVLEASLKGKFRVTPVLYDRQSAAIVDSYSKDKVRTESTNLEMMQKKSMPHVILYLMAIRLISLFIKKTRESAVKISYKQICQDEEASIKKILNSKQGTLNNGYYHSVSGNPDRVSGFDEVKYLERLNRGRFDFVFFICKFFDRVTFFRD